VRLKLFQYIGIYIALAFIKDDGFIIEQGLIMKGVVIQGNFSAPQRDTLRMKANLHAVSSKAVDCRLNAVFKDLASL
jgi:hypothetical protein